MSEADFNADTLIDEMDSGTLRPRRHCVIRALQEQISSSDADEEALIELVDQGAPINPGYWAGKLWNRIEALPVAEQGRLRLCVGLLHPNDCLDWYEAEYFILWAREQGLSERQIESAFRTPSDGRFPPIGENHWEG